MHPVRALIVFGFALSMFLIAPNAARAASVSIDAGALTSSIAAGLAHENPELSIDGDARGADFVVRVAKVAKDRLELRVASRAGDAILMRRVDVAEDAAPAVRVIVLLAAEAISAQLAAAPEPREVAPAPPREAAPAPPETAPLPPITARAQPETAPPQPETAPLAREELAALQPAETAAIEPTLAPMETTAPAAEPATNVETIAEPKPIERGVFRLSAGLAGGLWATPATPELGFFVAGHALPTDDLAIGARLTILGVTCCEVVGEGSVSADPTMIQVGLDAGYALAELGLSSFAVELGLGATWRSVDVVSLAFEGPGPTESSSGLEAMARAGVAFEPAWDRFALRFAAGVELHGLRRGVDLPPPYDTGTIALDPGLLSPWLEIGASASLF